MLTGLTSTLAHHKAEIVARKRVLARCGVVCDGCVRHMPRALGVKYCIVTVSVVHCICGRQLVDAEIALVEIRSLGV